MKKYEIEIIADGNDGDYQTSINTIDENNLRKIKPLIEKIKNFKPYTTEKGRRFSNNFPYGECLREGSGEKSIEELYGDDDKALQLFCKLLPFNEYGLHTINEVYIFPVREKERLL